MADNLKACIYNSEILEKKLKKEKDYSQSLFNIILKHSDQILSDSESSVVNMPP